MLELKDICVSFRSERQDKLFGTSRDQVLFLYRGHITECRPVRELGKTTAGCCRRSFRWN